MSKKVEVERQIKTLIPNLFKELWDREAQAFLVGGAIRDLYFGITPADFDFAVSDIGSVKSFLTEKGIRFFTLEKNNFTLVRAILSGKTADFTELKNNIETDVSERDFTINAMYFDVKKGVLVGNPLYEADLESKVLRLVSEDAIKKDPVRSLRAVRFAGAFNLTVEASTLERVKKGFYLLLMVPNERKYEESKKIFSMPFEKVADGFSKIFPEKKAELFAFSDAINGCFKYKKLNKEVNKNISYIDLCKLFIVSTVLHKNGDAVFGMGEKEMRFIETLESMDCSFDTLFNAFYKQGISVAVFAAALLCGLADADKVLKWSSVSVSGDEIMEKYGVKGEKVGEIKRNLVREECKKLYEKV